MAKRNLDEINYEILRLLIRYRGKPRYYTTSWISNQLKQDYKNVKDTLLRMRRQELLYVSSGSSLAGQWCISEAGLVLVKFYIKSKLFTKEKQDGKHLQDQRKRAHHPGDSDG